MARLELIDEIVDEMVRARAVNLPKICVKILFLSYWMYCVNTMGIKYRDISLDNIKRPNSGCIILCEKGTGKSVVMQMLKRIFGKIEDERKKRYQMAKDIKISALENSMIPLNTEQKKIISDFYEKHGSEAPTVFTDPTTSKNLCECYAQAKACKIDNLLFAIDEAGDRIFKDFCSKTPSLSTKEFVSAINQLYDGYCGMGQSRAAKSEGIKSQHDVGANFIFVSTAEFLKDYHVQQVYESLFAGGFARRLLYVNCPPIDKLNADRNFYKLQLDKFIPEINETIEKTNRGRIIEIDEDLKKILSQKGAGCGIVLDDEFLLLLFCCILAVWTNEEYITPRHWYYMVKVFNDIKSLNMDVVKHDTTNFDKVCIFMKEYMETNGKKKINITLIKDFCLRNRMCLDSKFKRWFEGLCADFATANISKYIIEKNKTMAWLSENFAYDGG